MTLKPPHPGVTLWVEWLKPLDQTVGTLAKTLGVTRKTLSFLINGRQDISLEMSVRLGKALGLEPDYFAQQQLAYDLANINPKSLRVKKLVTK